MGGAVWCDSYTISDVWESTTGWNQRKEIKNNKQYFMHYPYKLKPLT